MNTQNTFYHVDALAGSGKTYQALQWAIRHAHYNRQKTVLVLKSKQLIAQAYADALVFKQKLGSFVDITAINSDDLGVDDVGQPFGSVNAAILSYLRNSQFDFGEVLLITEAAFLQLPYWHKRWDWHCICDEIPNVTPAHTLNIPVHHRMITDHLKLTPTMAMCSSVSNGSEDTGVIKSYADNKMHDEVSAYFTPLAKEIVSDHYDVYTLTNSFHRVARDNSMNGYHQLQFFSVLKPTIFGSGKSIGAAVDAPVDTFASVTIMGACLKDSLLYYLWPQMGVRFEEHDEICSKLRYLQHTCGNRLQIKYLFERPWSKRSRDHTQKIGSETLSNLDIQIEAIKDEFNDDGFVYLVNKDKEDEVRSQLNLLGGEQLPNSPFGLNSYQHLNQAVVLSALNPSPAQYSFLSHMGVDEDAVRESLYHQACYQAIMRTSLRNKDATDPVKIIVSDLGVANSLQEHFPGSEVSSVITRVKEQPRRRIGRPPSASTKSRADTLSETRTRKRRIKQLISDLLAGSTPDTEEIKQIEANCRSDNRDLVQLKVLISSSFSCTSKQQNQLQIPIFRSIYSASPDSGIAVDITEYEVFMKQLQACSKTKLSNKHENALLCTTAFDGSLTNQTKRGLDNITHIWGVWLDIDGGVMPRDEIPALFPNIRMAVFNSWSSGNYRIFIPTTEYMSIGTYDDVLQQIVCAVEQQSPDWEIKAAQTAGRRPKCYVGSKQAEKQRKLGNMPNPTHGIDASKMTPSSMFYMPAQCGDDPSKSFFIDYNDDGRVPLDPSEFTKFQPVSVEELEDEYRLLEVKTETTSNINSSGLAAEVWSKPVHSSHTLQTIIDKAIDDYAGVLDGQNRHNAFFAAIHRIHYFGHVPISELKTYMNQCDYDHHQSNRYNGIIKSLQSERYRPKHETA